MTIMKTAAESISFAFFMVSEYSLVMRSRLSSTAVFINSSIITGNQKIRERKAANIFVRNRR